MIFDGHADIWTDVTCRFINDNETDIFRKYHLNKFKKGNVNGGIFVIWSDPPYDKNPIKRTNQVLESIKKELEYSNDILNIVLKYSDFNIGKNENKINVVLGIEGLSQIEDNLDLIDYYYEIGVRHTMLTWNEENDLATGWPGDVNRGLTKVGKDAVKKMQNMGITLDVSHLNDKSFWEVMDITQAPIIASHSNVRNLCPAMRNLDNNMIKEIANTKGLIGINSTRDFINEREENQDINHLVDHIDYIVNLVGIDYVGLGFDFCDYLSKETSSTFTSEQNINSPSAEGLSNVSEAKNILKLLIKRGYKESDIEKIAYKNFYRVFKSTWK